MRKKSSDEKLLEEYMVRKIEKKLNNEEYIYVIPAVPFNHCWSYCYDTMDVIPDSHIRCHGQIIHAFLDKSDSGII